VEIAGRGGGSRGGGGGWTIDGEAHRAFLLRDEEIVLGHPGGWWGFIYRRGRDLAGLADAGSATHEPFELEAEGTEGMV